MASSGYYDSGEQRANKVRALFQRIATRYDAINDIQSLGLHRRWKRRLVRLVGPRPGERALDLCCGTGDLALELARHGPEVTGLDFSPEMLAVAERRAEGAAAPVRRCVRFIRGDAMCLPFPDAHFEMVTVGYGLRNLADWKVGLAEMRRVARPGGRIAVLDFGKPANAFWRAIYFAYLRVVVPGFGLVFCGSAGAYSYILESLKHYPGQDGVAGHMRELGLVNVRIITILGGAMSINSAEKPGQTP